MVKKLNKKEQDNEVEEVLDPEENIVISDDNTDDDEICEVEHFRKLFIGGLAGQTNEDRLRQFYSKWGTVVDAVVMRDSVTRRSRGFGFVTYSKVVMVDKAQSNRPHVIDGKTVESKRALPRPEKQPTEGKKSASVKKLFVGGIKDVHDEESLNKYFSEFGNVVSIQILKDNVTGKRRGFALVEYDDYDAVDKAILQKTHLVGNILLDVRKSVYTKDDSKKNFEARKERPDTSKNNTQYTNSKSVPSMSSSMQNKNNRPEGGHLMQPQQLPFHGPPPYGQQPYHPMAPYPHGPPANNNHWGPQSGPRYAQPPMPYTQQPPPHMPQQPPPNYSGYSQAPLPPGQSQVPPSGSWNNYQATGNGNLWNGPPPTPQPPVCAQPPTSNWQNSQWGQTSSSAMPARPMPSGNAQTPMNWHQPPASQVAGPPPGMYQQQQNQPTAPPPPPPVQSNFGNGYQQNFAGGPTKHSNMHTNRMNPYNGPTNPYNNNSTAPGYGSGMTSGNRHRR